MSKVPKYGVNTYHKRTLKILKLRRNARERIQTTNRWVRYITILLFCCLLLVITGCENVRQSIGISTNPFSNKFEEKTKLNYKIIFGKVRPKEDDDD